MAVTHIGADRGVKYMRHKDYVREYVSRQDRV
jgi:hypothetical protein